MSLSAIISQLIKDEKLLVLPSRFTGFETMRTLLVSAEIDAVVQEPWPDTDEGLRQMELRGWCDGFTEGGQITVAEDPDRKPPDAMLARVHPVDVGFWSARVTAPTQTPGIRMLGAFTARDNFIALTWEFREFMTPFDEHVDEVRARWAELFGATTPMTGGNIHDYLTNFLTV